MKNRAVFLSIITLLWTYTFYKANQTLLGHELWSALLTLSGFMIMIGWIVLYHSKPHWVNKSWFLVVVWIGSLMLGFWGTFIMLSIPIDLLVFFHYGYKLISSVGYMGLSVSVHQKINLWVLLASGLFVVLGFIETLKAPRVKKIALEIDVLPHALKGLKIAQISDLHVGPTIQKRYVERVVRLTNATEPDFIFITGDLADAKANSINQHLHPLAQLKSRFGVFYVTGNHEYYWGIEEWIAKVKELGFIPLLNENNLILVNGVKVLIAGITDSIGGQFLAEHAPSLSKAILNSDEAVFKILLAHRPNVYIKAEQAGFDLQLSGHTHAGQFFPFNMLFPWIYSYYRHLNQHGRLWLYVNPGTGYWGPANRFGVPAEITLLICG